jgi:hypothetical protein
VDVIAVSTYLDDFRAAPDTPSGRGKVRHARERVKPYRSLALVGLHTDLSGGLLPSLSWLQNKYAPLQFT